MNTAIVPTTVSISEDQITDTTWLRYFDPKKALKGLNAHLGGLPSSDTPERYTRRNYIRGILYFLEWNGGAALRLPTEQVIKEFIAHLKHEKEWTRGNVVQNGVSSTTVAMGLISLPVMMKYKYSKSLACGTICASGTLGQIIPPSIVLILLGDVLGVPVGDLFQAAIWPGVMLVGAYIVYILIYAKLNPEAAQPIERDDSISRKQEVINALKAIVPPHVLTIVVSFALFAGVATPR